VHSDALSNQLYSDPAILLYQKLIASFRASMIVRTLRFSSRLLILSLGDGFQKILFDYWKESTPELYASDESLGFIRYLEYLNIRIEFLNEILLLEKTALSAAIEGNSTELYFDFDIVSVLDELEGGRLPKSSKCGMECLR
jgi:hypothetical protein